MLVYSLRRLLKTLPMVVLLLIATFLISRLAPGDPMRLLMSERARTRMTPERLEIMRRRFGLDGTLLEQLWAYTLTTLRGDLGDSFRNQRPVVREIGNVFPATVRLAGSALVLMVIIGVPLGVVAALLRGSWADSLLVGSAVVISSVPSFWLGLMLIYAFSVRLRLIPVLLEPSDWRALILPAVTLALAGVGNLLMLTRGMMLEVLREDYVRTARAKGLSERTVIFLHTLKNAAIPIVTSVGLTLTALLGGALIVEATFNQPGLGRLFTLAVQNRDYPLIQGITLFTVAIVILFSLLIDLLYSILDPRIRYA
jgi:peptide/nickel transport system permease protein